KSVSGIIFHKISGPMSSMPAPGSVHLLSKGQHQIAQLQQARQKAQQDEKVVKALEEMQQLKSKAMNEVSDDARQLQEKQIEIQKKIQKLEQSMYQQQ
ncbi:MAG: hypothetical protein R6V56_01825, partial [Lentisphaeria bacterium]